MRISGYSKRYSGRDELESEPTGNLLGNTPAFRAINVVAATDGALVTDDVNDFHRVEAGAARTTSIVVQERGHFAD